jgi:hypothetical protein
VRDVATLSGFGIGQELYCKDDLAVLLLFKKITRFCYGPQSMGTTPREAEQVGPKGAWETDFVILG